MSEFVRLYRYRELLGDGRLRTAAELRAALEISPATFKRDIAKLRDQLHMPIVFDHDSGAYRLDQTSKVATRKGGGELPGLWFNPEEVVSLLTIQYLLASLEPGLLGPKLAPLKARLASLLQAQGLHEDDIADRIRIVHAGKRLVPLQYFESIAAATLGRERLRITHFNRQNGETVERVVSPQRLVHYRDNWYLDAWCHLRNGVRAFAVDAIASCDVLDAPAKELDPEHLNRLTQSSYGIFGGAVEAWATLKFSPQRARWVSREQWHPDQKSRHEPDGSFVLEIPYADERELVGDILRFGAEVEVLAPVELRASVLRALHAAVGRYV